MKRDQGQLNWGVEQRISHLTNLLQQIPNLREGRVSLWVLEGQK